ncbi:Transcription initiation factor TFIID subunit like [Melia azedarach]|uniref:Transcription initiation factor TFIID subunit like n=1 Tax=Melia azedarach TaxID=155640 RepID=A0ACC1YI58_MELAZ|nr:Transcription initiation factor TFIID subunit like [Melia azedarach]
MSTLKLTARFSCRYLAACRNVNAWSPRAFVTATHKLSKSKKDKETIEACENVKEAAEAVKEGARVVKSTSEYVKDTTSATAKNVNNMTKEGTDKVKDLMTDAAMETTEAIKDKVIKK